MDMGYYTKVTSWKLRLELSLRMVLTPDAYSWCNNVPHLVVPLKIGNGVEYLIVELVVRIQMQKMDWVPSWAHMIVLWLSRFTLKKFHFYENT